MATYVLVHGGLTDGAYWTDVADRLRSTGHAVHVVERLPSVGSGDASALGGLDDDTAAVRDVVEAAGTPVVLVAHSGGGMAVTELADHPGVAHSVYVAALVPRRGESAMDLLAAAGGPVDWIVPGEDGVIRPTDDIDRLVEVLCGDTDEERARAFVSRLVGQSAASLTTPSTAPARGHAATFVVTERDAVFPPAAQERMAERADHVLRIDASHTPMLSRPDELAAVLHGAVG